MTALEWTGTVVLPDGRQIAERGAVRFLAGNRCEIAVTDLATRERRSGVWHEDDPVATTGLAGGCHVFVGLRCGFPVRHAVSGDGPALRAVTMRLDTGMVTEGSLGRTATVGEWCRVFMAAIDPADVVTTGTARRS